MPIAKGESWGTTTGRPSDLRVAADDADLARLLSDGTAQPTAVALGDVYRTIGARPIGSRDVLLCLPIDLMRITIGDGEALNGVAHVVAHRPPMRGGWLRGEVLVVMNAEFIGDYDVAPRGHPNDGRVESLFVAADLSARQRHAVLSRLRTATHLPHPHITTRSIRTASWEFERDMTVRVDGVGQGRTRTLTVEVVADAAVLYA
jgi:hypothetical protein